MRDSFPFVHSASDVFLLLWFYYLPYVDFNHVFPLTPYSHLGSTPGSVISPEGPQVAPHPVVTDEGVINNYNTLVLKCLPLAFLKIIENPRELLVM